MFLCLVSDASNADLERQCTYVKFELSFLNA